ncbi:MAG: type II secretion system F family protein [Candidatus Pacearchaeota archaeon]
MRALSKQEIRDRRRISIIVITVALFVSSIVILIYKNFLISLISFFAIVILSFIFLYFKNQFKLSGRIKKIEEIFPDFLQLMSSNLRAGMTIDKSILLSSRPEFAPLDEEILKTGKDIATSKNIESALLDMSKRIGSEKIHKTILLIISGIRSGGDLAILLEEISRNMREREFIEKKAYTNVLMYVIFIFLVVSILAPALFSLSNVLVEMLTKILSNVPKLDSSPIAMPFTLSKISISTIFTNYFSIIFILVIDLLASLVLGLISKGEEKQGLKYFPVIATISLIVFFVTKLLISNFMKGLL